MLSEHCELSISKVTGIDSGGINTDFGNCASILVVPCEQQQQVVGVSVIVLV